MLKFTAALAIAAFATSVLASPANYKCNSGVVQCCNSFQSASQYDSDWLATLFDVDIKQVTGQAGFQCNPMIVIGKGDGSKW